MVLDNAWECENLRKTEWGDKQVTLTPRFGFLGRPSHCYSARGSSEQIEG